MRSIRLASFRAPLVEADVPRPAVGPGDVRVCIDACGICHSDAHYRAGFGDIASPRTLGHEIAGTIEEIGDAVRDVTIGDRVAVHYLLSCGTCAGCTRGGEQFCIDGRMIGKHVDGGYAESIVVPERNAVPIPSRVPADVAAVMMCSTATAYHALRVAHAGSDRSVAILGLGGLGASALRLARALDVAKIAAVDVVPEKLEMAKRLGAIAIDARTDVIEDGYDIAVDFTGDPRLIESVLRTLAPGGALVLVALSEAMITFNPYRDILGKERRIVGCSDHTRAELVELFQLVSDGRLDLDGVISKRIPLEAGAINAALDALEGATTSIRTVILPTAVPART